MMPDDIRDNLYFASPEQRVKAIQLYCCDGFGSMLWNFRSEYAESYFKAWNIQVRLAWRVSPMTHTYLVEGYFSSGQLSLRNQIYSRYSKFVFKLNDSPSREIRFLSKVLLSDPRSTIRKNVWFLNNQVNDDITKISSYKMKQMLPKSDIPVKEMWRIGLLTALLSSRNNPKHLNLSKSQIQELLDSLCAS